MANSIWWMVKVSKDTDAAVRAYLAQSGGRTGSLSKFIEEAVRWRVLEQTAASVRERSGRMDSLALKTLIDAAVSRVRADRMSRGRRDTGSKRARAPASSRRTGR
jgi:hypothetical protein